MSKVVTLLPYELSHWIDLIVHVMFSNFIMSVEEVIIHLIIVTFFFPLVPEWVWLFDHNFRWADDGYGESGQWIVRWGGEDCTPLIMSLPRWIIVLLSLSSTSSNIVCGLRRGLFWRRGVSLLLRMILTRFFLSFQETSVGLNDFSIE